MPDYGFALSSAVLWACSAQFINHGLNNIPRQNFIHWVAAGVFFAMITGVITLSPFVFILREPLECNYYLVFSGVFTFALGTGSYYLTGELFGKRTEFASLFTKVKPLLSLLLAVYFLRESLTYLSLISALLISAGIALLFIDVKLKSLSGLSIILGLSTAAFWSFGELFMKWGIQDSHPIIATWIALVSGLVVFGIIAFPIISSVIKKPGVCRKLWPFVLHGVVSFSIAYSLFFYSIERIGLGRTVLINAFWPILSVLLSAAIRKSQNQPIEISKYIMTSAAFLLCGSLIQVLESL